MDGIVAHTQHEPRGGAATVRDFQPRDFDQVVRLMPPEWRFEGCSAAEDDAQARMDFAGILSECSMRLVAVSGAPGSATVTGVLFARIRQLPEPEDAQAWRRIRGEAREELAAGGEAARRACLYEEQLARRGELLMRAAGPAMGPDNELVLFVVGPDARGHGTGNLLMHAFESDLRRRGIESYWLQTDTSCAWQWYERHGYRRVADVELDASYPMPDALPPRGEGNACGASHAFMYRKALSAP